MSFEPIKITLETPLEHGASTITELVFPRNMRAGDLRDGIQVGTPTYDDCRTVASRITGVPVSVLAKMEWPDFSKVVNTVMDFFNNTPLIGEKE